AGAAKCTYGTGAFLLATVGRRPVRSRVGLASSVAWRLGERTTYCVDGQVYTVGAALAWLTRVGLLEAVERLDAAIAPTSAAGPLFVPALAGLGAPFWQPTARGALVGLTLAAGRGDLLRAVVDGIAAQVAELASAVAADLGRDVVRLRVDGGLTRSAALM